MTSAMIQFIVRLALTKLIELPPDTLESYEPWLRRKHIRWCLEHVVELTKTEEEVAELRDIRDMIQETNRLMEKHSQ